MRVFESVEFRHVATTGPDTTGCGGTLCLSLEAAADMICWLPDSEFVEVRFYELGQASNDFIPAVRFPFWRRHEGLLRSEWPQWFIDEFDDHVRCCSRPHNFPTRGVYSHSSEVHLN